MKMQSVLRVLRNACLIVASLVSLFVLIVLVSGSKGYAVQSDSMAPRLHRGDAVFVRKVSFDDLAVGDIVSAHFPGDDGIFTHRIIAIDRENRTVETRGDYNLSDDPMPTKESDIIGKLWLSVPYVGYLSLLMQNFTLIYILLGVVIVLVSVRVFLTREK